MRSVSISLSVLVFTMSSLLVAPAGCGQDGFDNAMRGAAHPPSSPPVPVGPAEPEAPPEAPTPPPIDVAGLVVGAQEEPVIGLFSLRVKAIFYAMITLAVASAFAVLASQLSDFTGGEDGRTFGVPELLRPGFRLVEAEVFGTAINGKLITYYLVFFSALALFLLLLRVVNSPFGRVLQAIRENDFRAEALGYRTVVYRTLANCLSAVVATLAGALMALWLRYAGPQTTLSFTIMMDILLIVVIGGMGTLYGAVIGAALFILAQNYLQALMKQGSDALAAVPLLANLLHPDRWLLWLGVLFVLSVYFFPTGIVGKLRSLKRK